MTIFTNPIALALDTAGNRISGAKMYSRLSGTTTPTNTFSDSLLTTPHTNPVVADSAGKFPIVYLNASVNYRFIFTDGVDPGNDPNLETQIYPLVDNYKIAAQTSYDFNITMPEAIGSNQKALGIIVVTPFTLSDEFAGSNARLETAPSASTVFSIQKNGVEVGTVTFASASQAGVFTTAAGSVAADLGDYFDIVAPAAINGATGLRVTFKGTVSV